MRGAGNARIQQEYWNRNLDPANIGKGELASREALDAELRFLDTPDRRWAQEQLGELAGRTVLEVGTGLGASAVEMAGRGARVVAMDISGERLRALTRLRAAEPESATAGMTAGGRIYLVQCAAEALPFRRGAFDGATSKSVLIHTDLDRSVAEISRVLRPGSVGAFVEPMTRNPLVNLYRRTLAPAEWRDITRYFAESEVAVFRRVFGRVETREFYLASFVAFGWQFAIPAPRAMRFCLGLINGVDRLAMAALPGLRKYAWFVGIRAEKGGDGA